MLATGLTLMAIIVGFELYIIKQVPAFGRLVRRNSKVSLAFSLGLSFLLTMLFPAAGLIIFMASIGSTLAIQPIYRGMNVYDRQKIVWRGRIARWSAAMDTASRAVSKCQRAVMWVFHPVTAYKTRR